MVEEDAGAIVDGGVEEDLTDAVTDELALGDGVGEVDLALDGTKGTDAGFKFDLIVVLPEVEGDEDDTIVGGNGASRNFCNAFVAAACLAA